MKTRMQEMDHNNLTADSYISSADGVHPFPGIADMLQGLQHRHIITTPRGLQDNPIPPLTCEVSQPRHCCIPGCRHIFRFPILSSTLSSPLPSRSRRSEEQKLLDLRQVPAEHVHRMEDKRGTLQVSTLLYYVQVISQNVSVKAKSRSLQKPSS